MRLYIFDGFRKPSNDTVVVEVIILQKSLHFKTTVTRIWANAQRDGRPAEYRWCPLFNAAKFGWYYYHYYQSAVQ